MEKGYDSDDDNSSQCTRQGILLRILIAAFAIVTLLLIIIAIALILTQKPIDLSLAPTGNESQNYQQYHRFKANYAKFTFDQLFSGKMFLLESFDHQWLPDGSLLTRKDEYTAMTNEALRYPPDSFESHIFLDDYDLASSMSTNGKYAYRTQVIRQLFRYSTERVYTIVKIDNGTANEKFSWQVGPIKNATIQAFYWNPSEGSNDFIFVHNFNVYYQEDPEHPEKAIQLTTDGDYYFRYGVANWLYEEEILEKPDAVWWSKTGQYVSFLRFDDKQVNRVFLPTYSSNDPYVEYFELPYPKAGVPHNTEVTQFIWDREKNKIVEALAPDELRTQNESYYVFQNVWMETPYGLHDLGRERLISVWANREQTKIYFTLCNETDCIVTFTQEFSVAGRRMWSEPEEVGNIFTTKTGFFTILPHYNKADNNIYNHIAHIELETSGTGKVTKWIGENYDVVKIEGYYEEKDIITFSAYGIGIGTYGLYSVAKAANRKLETAISQLNSLLEDCVHGSYNVDPTGKRAALLCSTPFDNARLFLMNVDKPRSNVLLDGGTHAVLPFDKLNLTYGEAELPSGITAQFELIQPPKITEGQKLPLILDLYGGPNTKRVLQKTPTPHYIQISSQYQVAVGIVDVRGTAGHGWNTKEPVFRNMGKPEAQDTLDMIQVLLKKFPFLDEDNVAVIGWSYGGYLATQIAIRDQGDSVKCAAAIAPVTDFSYYDTAYTERYLGLPLDNPQGYDRTNLIPHAKNLTNVKYFLAHGEKDDNVHYQNSARWSEALQLRNIHFRQLVYANEAHSLTNKVKHLYSEIQQFFVECFEPFH
ncbi:unnamed protein product [Caenorhabditis angaria]|uniref:Uncharacterized protein n=1 Tax=Caenorhabditis angaria TaxID=860376 RepID=A0A9P1J4Z8_9PELO|nr:unnamed protein product [Caenorhabditis angaria]